VREQKGGEAGAVLRTEALHFLDNGGVPSDTPRNKGAIISKQLSKLSSPGRLKAISDITR